MKENFFIYVLISVFIHTVILSFYLYTENKNIIKKKNNNEVIVNFIMKDKLLINKKKDNKANYLKHVKNIRTKHNKKDTIFKKKSQNKNYNKMIIANKTNSLKKQISRYQDIVKQKIAKNRIYPKWAKDNGIEGIVFVNFTLISNGKVTDIFINKSSNSRLLDESSIKAIKKSQPFPKFPNFLENDKLSLKLAFVYKITNE